MSSANKELSRRFTELFSTGDERLADTLLSDDVTFHGTRGDGEIRGLAAMKAFVAAYRRAFPDARSTVVEQVSEGDKRIILVDGKAAGAVNRVPAANDIRSNMVRGGAAKPTDLTAREREICQRLGPHLRERGLLLVGIDVIGGWLTEINVTSPTGIRAIRNLGGPDVASLIWDKIEQKRKG